jgi:1-acyl-sn-glycerol-3-phosphate acyltransferase
VNNTVLRRLITVPTVIVACLVATVALPALLSIAVIVDLFRPGRGRWRWVTVRLVLFGWLYLVGEVWAVLALGTTALLGRRARLAATYRLQATWVSWNLAIVERVFGVRFVVEGGASVAAGPLILLSRHVSIIDTLLPAAFVTRRHGIRLRYVLKSELLVDPALDIAGNRLPNCFVTRSPDRSEPERKKIRELANALGPDEGVIIFPEGTRFTPQKRDRRRAEPFSDRALQKIAQSLDNVLPPRPGGTLAILDATDADVVLLVHTGLEGFATVSDVWAGDLVGATVKVSFRRIPRSQIPESSAERVRWLFETWEWVDGWVASNRDSSH